MNNFCCRTHLVDLMDVTKEVHYENFRCRQLTGKAGAPPNLMLANGEKSVWIEFLYFFRNQSVKPILRCSYECPK